MLTALTIRDLAVVAKLDLDFSSGLTVLTGETGAGKSILLTAIGLALGDRADPSLLRPGAEKAEIELVFDTTDSPASQQWLCDQELEDEQLCIIRRQISKDGRSRAWINGRTTTLKTLQELSEKLVEIHGQHAHLNLLQNSEQLRLLDNSADTTGLASKVKNAAQNWQQLRDRLEQLERYEHDSRDKEALLRYQVDELEALKLEEIDYPQLVQEHLTLANAEKILMSAQQLIEQLYESDQYSVNTVLGKSAQTLESLGELAPDMSEPGQLINEAQILLQEAVSSIRSNLDRLEPDPQRMALLEEQIDRLNELSRKHQTQPDQLQEKLDQLADELKLIEHSSEEKEQAILKLSQIEEEYWKLADELSAARSEAALKLENKISGFIQTLGMPQGRFQITASKTTDKKPKLNGNDQIEFLVSANPGLPPKSLGKVASGGELSRISLAIQVAATGYKNTPTLIFDEVDSGIGGGVAEIVGQQLHALGTDRQIFCVTHLPQVASQGNNHLLIKKQISDQVTETEVALLNGEKRVGEIARMLGGVKITEQTLSHAREMLETGSRAESEAYSS